MQIERALERHDRNKAYRRDLKDASGTEVLMDHGGRLKLTFIHIANVLHTLQLNVLHRHGACQDMNKITAHIDILDFLS